MEDPIPVRTLDNATPYPGVSYNDGLIALVEHSCELYPRQAVRVEAIVLTLCTSGKASLHLNGTPYEAKAASSKAPRPTPTSTPAASSLPAPTPNSSP